MKSPSMYITHEDEKGVVLVYRSSRQGFTHYLMGMDKLTHKMPEFSLPNTSTSIINKKIHPIFFVCFNCI